MKIMNGTATVSEMYHSRKSDRLLRPGLYVFCEYRICKVFQSERLRFRNTGPESVFSWSCVFRVPVLMLDV